MLICRLLKKAKEAIVDYSRQECILKEGHLVDELSLIARCLGAMAPHGQIGEDGLEVGSDGIV